MNTELRRALLRNIGETMRRQVAAEMAFLAARQAVREALAQLALFDADAAEDRAAMTRERAAAIAARGRR